GGHEWSTGSHIKSSSSSTIQRVRMARFSTETWATSNLKPRSLSSRPPRRASSRPLSDRSTSTQPVNRFSRFQTLSPWRKSTSVYGTPVLLVGRCAFCPDACQFDGTDDSCRSRSLPPVADRELHVVTL